MVEGHSHWLNRFTLGSEEIDVDLTGDQFGLPALQMGEADSIYPETRVRRSEELTADTLLRARVLAERARLSSAAKAIDALLEQRKGVRKGT
jgi:hypothetical protein